VIDDDALDAEVDRIRGRIGRHLKTIAAPNLEEATKDGIRRWATALGDRDPKWTDEEYAAGTRFGGITAPPSMLYAFDARALGERSGFSGFHSHLGGAVHEWFAPIRRNAAVSVDTVFTALDEIEPGARGRRFTQTSEVTFTDQDGTLLARTQPWGVRARRVEGALDDEYAALEPAHWTAETLAEVAETYRGEQALVRGATPRSWEDVAVGDPIGPLQRGPWSQTMSLAFLQAIGALFMLTHSYWYEYLDRHPAVGMLNGLGVPEGPAKAHWDDEFAAKTGIPLAYNYGPEIIGWFTTACTYWCGDAGWLRRLEVEMGRFNLVGDLLTVGGRVTALPEPGRVEGELALVDQRGDTTARATFVIELPLRGGAA
jgi:acyl dehydratase